MTTAVAERMVAMIKRDSFDGGIVGFAKDTGVKRETFRANEDGNVKRKRARQRHF